MLILIKAIVAGLFTGVGVDLFSVSGSILFSCFFTLASFLIVLFSGKAPRVCQRNGLYFGLVISSALIIGRPVYEYHDISLLWATPLAACQNIAAFIGFSFFLGALSSTVFSSIITHQEHFSAFQCHWFDHRRAIPITAGVILLTWLPIFWVFRPGLENYDIMIQYFEAAAGGSTSHPMLHTGFAGLCDRLGTLTGIHRTFFYCSIQTTLLAIMLAWLFVRMIRHGAPRWLILVSALFITINPVVQLIAISTTKDVFVCAYMLGMLLMMHELLTDPECFCSSRSKLIILGVFILLACLNRHNTILAMLLLPLFFFPLKKYWKRVGIVFLVSILCFFAIDKLVWPRIAAGRARAIEPWSVPLQQVCKVLPEHVDEMTDWEKDQVTRYLSWDILDTTYNARFNDPLKQTAFSCEAEWYKDVKPFLLLWARLGIRYPVEYITTFIDLNIPYWYPLAETNDPISFRKYIEVDFWEPDESSALHRWYRDAASYKLFEHVPFFGELFSLHLPIWLMLFAIFALAAYGKKRYIPMVLIPLAYTVSFIFGPVSNFRYVMPAFVMYPLFLWIIVSPGSFSASPLIPEKG